MSETWDTYLRKGHYPLPKEYDLIEKQFSVLNAFEWVIEAQKLSRLATPFDRYSYYKNNIKQRFLTRHTLRTKLNIKRTAILKSFTLNKRTTFSYIDTFLDECEPYFIEDFKQFSFKIDSSEINKAETNFIMGMFAHISTIKNPEVDKIIEEKFQNYKQHDRQIWMYRMIGNRESFDNLEIALNNLVRDTLPLAPRYRTDLRDYHFRSLFGKPINKDRIQSLLFSICKASSSPTVKKECLKYLIYFPNKQVVRFVRRQFRKISDSKEDRQFRLKILKQLKMNRNKL